MSGFIDRIQSRDATAEEQPRVLDVADEETDRVLDALSTDTRRALYRTLFEEPGTPSELAARLDTSVQNVHYHLSKLADAGLVEGVDTRYSEKGNEMTVYGPASDPLVLVGDQRRRGSIRRSLVEIVGGLGLLGVASLLVQWGVSRLGGTASTETAVGPASQPGPPAASGPLDALLAAVVEPGVLFFVGALAVVLLAYLLRD